MIKKNLQRVKYGASTGHNESPWRIFMYLRQYICRKYDLDLIIWAEYSKKDSPLESWESVVVADGEHFVETSPAA